MTLIDAYDDIVILFLWLVFGMMIPIPVMLMMVMMVVMTVPVMMKMKHEGWLVIGRSVVGTSDQVWHGHARTG